MVGFGNVPVGGGVGFGVGGGVGVGVIEPHGFPIELAFRGEGEAVVKSDALLSVSPQPLPARSSAVVFVSAAASIASAQLAVP